MSCLAQWPSFRVARWNGRFEGKFTLNAELLKKAAEKVLNPNILVNLVSKRVRQLNAAGGTGSRPLLAGTAGWGAGDIALAELVEQKMGWEVVEVLVPETGPAKRRVRT